MPRTIEFYFDFMSPFAYLANHKLTEIADRYGMPIAYKAIDLARAKLAIGNNGPSNRDLPVKLRYLHTDMRRWAERYGIPLAGIKNHNSRQLNIGTSYAEARGVTARYAREAYHLIWGIGAAPDDEAVLRTIARTMAWDEDEFLAYLASEAGVAAYDAQTARASEKGVFGVPTVIIDDQMWWGNDRLFMVEEYLRETADRLQPQAAA